MVRIHLAGLLGTVPKLLFEKKLFIPALQRMFLTYLGVKT